MPRLLIQCQGSPVPLSFKMTRDKIDAVVHHYHSSYMDIALHSRRHIIPLENDAGELYHINLALASWMCVIDEPEPEADLSQLAADSEDIIPF